MSGSHLCVESEKDVTTKGSILVLANCSRTEKQVGLQLMTFANHGAHFLTRSF